MEILSDSLGIDVVLKLIPVWNLFSHHGSYTESQFIILKVRHELHTPFLQTVHFGKNIFCLIYLLVIIAKGLAISLLGGVISTQIVQY